MSHATIVSLSTDSGQEEKTPEEWGREVKQCLKSLTIILQNYGRGELNIVSQIRCQITRERYSIEGVLQVQKAAPVDLLLGTDLQPHLGYVLMQMNEVKPHVNLVPLQGTERKSKVDTSAMTVNETGVEPTATVCLVSATRVPGRHSKLV